MNIKIRGKVFASLTPGKIEIHIGYNYGMIDGGYLWTIDSNEIPIDCRMPNTYLWVTMENREIIKIERMSDEEIKANELK